MQSKLATLLKRNVIKLQERYIGPLVAQGLLRMKYPEVPNHPNQPYSADRLL